MREENEQKEKREGIISASSGCPLLPAFIILKNLFMHFEIPQLQNIR